MKTIHRYLISLISILVLISLPLSSSGNYSGGAIKFLPDQGSYIAPLKVKIEFKPFMHFFGQKLDTTVYYTIDGVAPSTDSTLYQGEIYLNATGDIQIRAIAVSGDKKVLGKIYSVKYRLMEETEGKRKSETDLSPRFASPLIKGGQGGSDSNEQNSSHKKYAGKKDEYSAVFSGDAYLSEVLLFDMGCLVLKFTHPLSHHRDTIMQEKEISGNGDTRVVFDTEYRSWKKGHHMVWSIVFNNYRIPKDIKFISDSGTFKTGSFYNRIKSNILNGIKEIAGKMK